MHRKGAQDKKRAQPFGKLIREIIVAAKQGLPDPAMNPRLRAAVHGRPRRQHAARHHRARDQAGDRRGQGEDYEEVRYEGYGPGGVAIIVEALTDNRNRTAGDVRTIFAKNGGALGETNSVAFLFERVGAHRLSGQGRQRRRRSSRPRSRPARATSQSSADTPRDHHRARGRHRGARRARARSSATPQEARQAWRPRTPCRSTTRRRETLFELVEALDDNDDVQTVFANFEVSDEVLQRLAS